MTQTHYNTQYESICCLPNRGSPIMRPSLRRELSRGCCPAAEIAYNEEKDIISFGALAFKTSKADDAA